MSHKLSQLATEYIDYLDEQIVRKKKSWQTGQLTRRAFKKLLECLGDIDLMYISVEHAERFQDWLLDRYAKSSVNMYMKTLSPAFKWAYRRRHWTKSHIFKVKDLKITGKKMRIYTVDEFNSLLQAAESLKQNSTIWCGRLLCGHDLGMRRSEVLHLTTSDVDFEKGEIHIQPKEETKNTLEWEPKDRECRVLPMTKRVSNILLKIHNNLPEGQAYLLLAPDRNHRIFEIRRTGTLSQRIRLNLDENFSMPFTRILKKAKIRHGTFHDLRKTYLTTLAESGVPTIWLQELAGHSNSKTTEQYYLSVRRKEMFSEVRKHLVNLSHDPMTL